MAGRGKKKIISAEDMAKAEAMDNCQNNTICRVMGWNEHFLEDRKDILKILQKKRAEHKAEVRANQRKHSKTHPVGAIWLGKQSLGQTDRSEISGKDGAPLPPIQINIMPPTEQ
jgi:hypothetical protein